MPSCALSLVLMCDSIFFFFVVEENQLMMLTFTV